MTDAELAELVSLREAQLRDLAEGMGLHDIDEIPPLVRWIMPDEQASTMVTCLNEAGFAAESIGGTGIGFDKIPEAQRGEPLSLAMWTCEAQYTVDPRTQIPMTDAQFRILYDYLNVDYRACLAESDLEFSEAPSFEAFKEGYTTGHPWVPFSEVSLADVGQEEYAALEDRCPQSPPSVELYGPLPRQPDSDSD